MRPRRPWRSVTAGAVGALLLASAAVGTTVLTRASADTGTEASASASTSATAGGTGEGYLHTDGSQIVDENGDAVRLTGLNWFGNETSNHTFHGLWARSYQDLVDQMVDLGYNTLRIPYSDDVLVDGTMPDSIDYSLNPDLDGLTSLEVMDTVIDYAGSRGMRVILDRHRPDSSAQSALWYTDAVPESTWIANWTTLAERYADDPTVIGADLHNEPHNDGGSTGACWGCGDTDRDWRLAAQRAGDAVLDVNPDWLILVEGVDCVDGDCGWWGGNLSAADEYPVELSEPDQLVYSIHEYATSVYHQTWFDAADYPDNLAAIWDAKWGYLIDQDVAPVLVGEFGSTLADGADGTDAVWMRTLMEYLGEGDTGASFTYWSLNPNSGDTGGILQDDWTTVQQTKQDILAPYLTGTAGTSTDEGDGDAGATTSASASATGSTTEDAADTSDATTTSTAGGATGTGSGCTAQVTVNSWTGGYQGTLTVRNDGAALDPWTVTAELADGTTLSSGWNASVTVEDGVLTALAPEWDTSVGSGETVSVGFVASGPSDPAPSAVALDGTACTVAGDGTSL